MINLEPIPKKIQERLKEKMNVMGRTRQVSPNKSKSKSVDYGLTHAKMATRSTFLRMTSGQLNPVILMGGKLKDDGTIPGGYKDIYGQRTYRTGGSTDITETLTADTNAFVPIGETIDVVTKATKATSYNTVNNLKRPTPGVKSVEASFKGGVKANREATISWTCWDWTELDLLMPHFLAHGKTVLVEWGWVYDKATLQNLPNFVKTDTAGNKFISADVYNNYKNKVVDENGDFDLMVGVIKNFEYTTREDGGFDCQTIISSVGVNLLDTEEPNKGFVDPSTIYNIDLNDTKEMNKQLDGSTGSEEDILIQLNSTIAFKAFLNQLATYLVDQTASAGVKLGSSKDSGEYRHGYIANEDKYIIDIKKTSSSNYTTLQPGSSLNNTTYQWSFANAWVRWGWFEDNILSKFISLTSKDKREIISQFRSVENILDNGGKETEKYESVKIRNSVDLETVDISSYILPGQFYPLEKRTIRQESVTTTKIGNTTFKGSGGFDDDFGGYSTTDAGFDGKEITLDGDTELVLLKQVVDTFPDFSTKDVITDKKGKPVKSKRVEKDGKTGVQTPGKFGYLRNMLINIDVIIDAFGARELSGKIEAGNLFDGIQSMFNTLNAAGNLNFWNFNIVQDDTDHQRVKIIDDATTAVDFNKPVKDQRTKFNLLGEVQKPGIFYFPVWQHDSIVKRQNVNAKVPSSLQIATMYGSNVNAVGEFGSTDSSFGAEGVAAGAVSNSEKDRRLSGLNIAIKNRYSENIGLKSGNSEEPLTIRGGEDIITFLLREDVQATLNANYKEIQDDIAKRIEESALIEETEAINELFDIDTASPSTDFLTNEELLFILDEDNYQGDLDNKDKNKIFREAKSFFGRKFNKNGSIREPFKGNIGKNITSFGKTSNSNIPLLVPLELELDIDGIGGIYPGNSFHSTYVPVKYQNHTVFQAKEVNHRLDDAGWTTTISGIMRTTLNQLFIESDPNIKTEEKNAIKNYQDKVRRELRKSKQRDEANAKADEATRAKYIGTKKDGRRRGGLFKSDAFKNDTPGFYLNVLNHAINVIVGEGAVTGARVRRFFGGDQVNIEEEQD